jgi:hypothetical protein
MSGRRGRLLLLVLALVAAISAIVAGAAWIVAREGDEELRVSTTEVADGTTLAADGRELARQAASVGHAVYWVGPVSGNRYEVTKTTDGRAYVRYLTPGVRAGDPRPGFLTVGTYPIDDAFAVTRATSQREDSRAVRAPASAVAFYSTSRPQSVYLAFESSELQIEVFHPTPREARRLVESGRVRPVG